MASVELACGGCGNEAVPALAWRHFANDTWHLGAACPQCGRHLRWVSQTADWLAAAPPAPFTAAEQTPTVGPAPSYAQLRYLHVLGHRGPAPATVGEAAKLIRQLKASEPNA